MNQPNKPDRIVINLSMENIMRWTRYDYTNKNSRGQDRLKKDSKAASIGIYFFIVAMITCAIIIVLGQG